MNPILKSIILCLFLTLNLSCKNEKKVEFESKKWILDKIGHSNVRVNMTEHLIESKILIGIEFDSVVNLLGNEFYKYKSETNKKMIFTIKESYGFDIDPLYTQGLIIEIEKNTKKVLRIEYSESEDKRSLMEKMFSE